MRAALLVALFLSVITSSLAYLVNVPNDNRGWNKYGPQPLTWSRVNTDPKTFAVVLTNQDRTALEYDIVIAEYVDGKQLSTKIYPPGKGGFPTGKHFRVNLVKSAKEPNTILAQSNEFTIKD